MAHMARKRIVGSKMKSKLWHRDFRERRRQEGEKEMKSCMWCKFARRHGWMSTRVKLTGKCVKNNLFGVRCKDFDSLWSMKRSGGALPSQWDRWRAGGDNTAPWPGYGMLYHPATGKFYTIVVNSRGEPEMRWPKKGERG